MPDNRAINTLRRMANPRLSMPTEDPTDLDFTDIFAKREVAAPTPEQQAKIEADALIGANEVKKGGFCVSMTRPGLRMRGPRPQHPTVLVVEDEPITSKLLERILTGAGYKPWIARSGKEVVEKLRSPPPPDLILMDVMLPDIEGFKIVERIRQHKVIGDIPIIMLSGRAELADVTRGFECGADGYVTKPAARAALLGVIEQVLEGGALSS